MLRAGIWFALEEYPTLVAALAAAVAYGSLALTSFRGFLLFGMMGAVGSLCCWLMAFTVLPALLCLMDAKFRHRMAAPFHLGCLGNFINRGFVLVAGATLLVTLVAAVGFGLSEQLGL